MALRAPDPPLDEIQWRSPPLAQQMQGIHSNSVLPYFAHSPFCDQTSNNAVLMNQAIYNQSMLHIVATREAFEGRLKIMSGLEYIVAQEPSETTPGAGTGVWVIRKQTRRKRQGQDDELTVHGTYFIVGENVYMAPAIGDVIGSRLLSIFTSLNKFVSLAAELPNFTPALGHTYLPSSTDRSKAPETRSSHENTPALDSLPTAKKPVSVNSNAILSSRLLAESFEMSLRYGDEYMDENPITGHPGDFHLSTTGRRGREKISVPPSTRSILPSREKTPLTLDVKANEPPGRKGSKGDKSPKSAGLPKPKRRKSKALSSAGGISPS